MRADGQIPDGLDEEVADHVAVLEAKTGKRFGDRADPLLVSVRSGAAVSMPGMMDTILNVGLDDESVEGLAATTGNRRFAYDSYRRLIQMYGETVDGIDGHRFEEELSALKRERGVDQDVDLTDDDLAELVTRFKRIYEDETGRGFAQDAREQLAPRGRGRIPVVGHPARPGVPPRARHPRRSRHRRECRPDGLRQQGRHVCDRSRFHTRPVNGRPRGVRRVPRQRAGRGRRRRDPHAGAAGADGGGPAGGVHPLRRDDPAARGALPRRPGHGVHGRGGTALPPPDAHGEADRGGRTALGGGHGGRGPDLPRGGRRAHRPGPARPASPPDARPEGVPRRRRQGAERLARSGRRRDRLRRRHGGGPGPGRRQRDPRPLGDHPGRHQRDDLRAGDPHRPRRDDLARRRGRAGHGEAVRRRLRGPRARPRGEDGHGSATTSSARAT